MDFFRSIINVLQWARLNGYSTQYNQSVQLPFQFPANALLAVTTGASANNSMTMTAFISMTNTTLNYRTNAPDFDVLFIAIGK